MGYDANAHHTIWGSIDINDRDRELLEFLVTTDLKVFNKGNESTFCTAVSREVLDLTVYSRWTTRDVVEWRVTDELSRTIMEPIFKGMRLVSTETVKYLGVTLDKKLSWKEHLDNCCRSSSICFYFWMCRRSFGQTWGLKPSMLHWIQRYSVLGWYTRLSCGGSEYVRALILSFKGYENCASSSDGNAVWRCPTSSSDAGNGGSRCALA